MSDRERARAALKRGYDSCEARIVCNCDKSDCSAYLDAIASALAQARAEALRRAAEVALGYVQEAYGLKIERLDVGSEYYAGRRDAAADIRALAEGGE